MVSCEPIIQTTICALAFFPVSALRHTQVPPVYVLRWPVKRYRERYRGYYQTFCVLAGEIFIEATWMANHRTAYGDVGQEHHRISFRMVAKLGALGYAPDPMTGAPSPVDQAQLDELHLNVVMPPEG